MKFSDAVAKYIEIRDQREAIKREFDAADAPLKQAMTMIEGALLNAMQQEGITSQSTPLGTAFITTKTSATVADREAFFRYCVENDEGPLMEIRAAKAAIKQYADTNNELPPGINWFEERTVSIRRK